MSFSYLQLRTAVLNSGTNYVTSETAGRFVNSALTEIYTAEPWPFLEATTTLATPANISDLGRVLSINTSDGTSLRYAPRGRLTDQGFVLSTQGSPTNWYFEGTTIQAYPASTGLLTIRYIRLPVPLLADGDLMALPDQHVQLVIDGALIHAMKEDEAFDEAAALRQEFNVAIENLRQFYSQRSFDSDFIIVTDAAENAWGF